MPRTCSARPERCSRPGVHLHSEQGVGLLPQVLAFVEQLLPVQLVRREVQVPGYRERQRVRPQHARVVHERVVLPVGPAAQDRVVLVVGQVDAALVIRLQPVRGKPSVTQILHRPGHLLIASPLVEEGVCADAVESAAGQ